MIVDWRQPSMCCIIHCSDHRVYLHYWFIGTNHLCRSPVDGNIYKLSLYYVIVAWSQHPISAIILHATYLEYCSTGLSLQTTPVDLQWPLHMTIYHPGPLVCRYKQLQQVWNNHCTGQYINPDYWFVVTYHSCRSPIIVVQDNISTCITGL